MKVALGRYLPGNSIIHGDFHPGNVVINDSKIVFIGLVWCCKSKHNISYMQTYVRNF